MKLLDTLLYPFTLATDTYRFVRIVQYVEDFVQSDPNRINGELGSFSRFYLLNYEIRHTQYLNLTSVEVLLGEKVVLSWVVCKGEHIIDICDKLALKEISRVI